MSIRFESRQGEPRMVIFAHWGAEKGHLRAAIRTFRTDAERGG